jgi:DegV family protein with EDD domain
MSYRIVVDSCGELTQEMKDSGCFVNVPLTITVGEHHIVDDETFDQADFLKKVAGCPDCPKSSCPSPEKYMESYRCDADHVYAVTLSANLSGSYNSAVLGKNLYEEEYGDKPIHVFDSRSASVGQTLIALKIAECEEAGMSFEEVVETVENYIVDQITYFVLESLEALRKNGRLTGMKALVATALNIKPYCGATPEGTIFQAGQARGIKKALSKMVDVFVEQLKNPQEKIVAISHCNCFERALSVKRMLEEKIKVKKIIVLDTNGISSTYASDGGIIVSG